MCLKNIYFGLKKWGLLIPVGGSKLILLYIPIVSLLLVFAGWYVVAL